MIQSCDRPHLVVGRVGVHPAEAGTQLVTHADVDVGGVGGRAVQLFETLPDSSLRVLLRDRAEDIHTTWALASDGLARSGIASSSPALAPNCETVARISGEGQRQIHRGSGQSSPHESRVAAPDVNAAQLVFAMAPVAPGPLASPTHRTGPDASPSNGHRDGHGPMAGSNGHSGRDVR